MRPALVRGVVGREVAVPDLEVGLRHAGVGGEDEQHRVRVRQEVERQLRLGADRIEPRRVEDDESLLQQRVREVDDRVAPARDLDAGFVGVLSAARIRPRAVAGEAVLARELRPGRASPATRVTRASLMFCARSEIERERLPLVGVVLELGDGRVLGAGLDRQEADRRRARGVVQQLGRAHRRAARRRRQKARAEVGEEDRVDELRLAARELGDERDDELVLMEPLDELRDLACRSARRRGPGAAANRAGVRCLRRAGGANRRRPRNVPRVRGRGRSFGRHSTLWGSRVFASTTNAPAS